MLIIFHFTCLFILKLLRHRKRIKFLESLQKTREREHSPPENATMDLENNLTFEPPVFRQRYGKVYEILLDERWRKSIKKLCDFGCAEFGLFVFIKKLSSLNHIFCIDIDEDTLRDNIRRIYPLTLEYLRRRETPLQISVFAGSVSDPDYRLECTDAVVAVELIEHLYPDVLDAFPYNVFSFIEPKIVIITTPNSDFNILFSADPKRMRHYDHKFEWSRDQFEDWANNIVTRFPDYSVSFSGIGEGPAGTEDLGECSQMAVFVRKDVLDEGFVSKSYSSPCICDSKSSCKGLTEHAKMSCPCVCALCCPNSSQGVCTYYSFSKQIADFEITDNEEASPSYGIHYKFIEKVDYPFHYDERTEEEKMIDEFRYRINNLGYARGRFFVEERNRSEIPLCDLIYGHDSSCITKSELGKLLTKYDYKIEECIFQETGQLETCVIYEPVMEEYSSSSAASGYDDDYPMYQPNEESILDWEDWDEPYVKEESDENFTSSTELLSSGLSTPVNQNGLQSDVDKRTDSRDSNHQKTSCGQRIATSKRQENTFEENISTLSLPSKNAKIRIKKLVEEKTFGSSGKIRPARTFMNNFLNPMAERLNNAEAMDMEPSPGPSTVASAVKQAKKPILKVSSTDKIEAIRSFRDSIVENVFNTLSNAEEKSLYYVDDSESSITSSQILSEDNFLTAIENDRNIEEPSSSDVTQPEDRSELLPDIEIDENNSLSMHSEYQKSSTALPQCSPDNSEEIDFFEETSTTPKLSSEDNKVHLKKLVGLEKAVFVPLTMSSHQRLKIDPNRINELDKFSNIAPGRAFFNHFLSPQAHVVRRPVVTRDRDNSPGPSNAMSKKKRRSKKGGSFTDVEDEGPMDDIKSITNCIVENTLNRLDIVEVEKTNDDVIEFNIEPELALVPVAGVQEPTSAMELDSIDNITNREGNFYTPSRDLGNDVSKTDSESNEENVENLHVLEDPPILFAEQTNEDSAGTPQQQLENQVARASREALFDPNSVQDLLEDFEIPPPVQEAVDILEVGNNIVLVGIRSLANGVDQQVMSVENGFPQWLLQIFGTPAAQQDGSNTSTSSDEPHYYCQGDGLGVHPSVMAVEVEEEEDDEETTSSSNNTTDFAEVDPGVSSQDMSSLPEDSQAITDNQDLPEETDDGLRTETNEQTEYFDTVSNSSDTGIDSN